jgi:hypothetical protein
MPKIDRSPRIPRVAPLPSAPNMNDSKQPLIDPIGVKTMVAGFAVGLAIIAAFCLMSATLGQTLLVNHNAIPYQ